MSESHIDPIVSGAAKRGVLPDGHHAKAFVAGLPDAHPVRRLFCGEAQWLGDNKNVYGFLRLFSEVYEDCLRRADENGILRSMAPLDLAAIKIEDAEFEHLFPDDILYRGCPYKLRTLLKNAREAIAVVTREFPPLRTVGLDAFNRTFARLVRAVRMS